MLAFKVLTSYTLHLSTRNASKIIMEDAQRVQLLSRWQTFVHSQTQSAYVTRHFLKAWEIKN